MGYFLKSTCKKRYLRGDIEHGDLSDRRRFLNSTCDIGTPIKGPIRRRGSFLWEISIFKKHCIKCLI